MCSVTGAKRRRAPLLSRDLSPREANEISHFLPSTHEQAQKNVFLEERVQVLQQQNEDLLAQIQMNLAISRYVSAAVSASVP